MKFKKNMKEIKLKNKKCYKILCKKWKKSPNLDNSKHKINKKKEKLNKLIK